MLRQGLLLEIDPPDMDREMVILRNAGDCSRQRGTLLICLNPAHQRLDASMPNISSWSNEPELCFLSDVIEKGPVPEKFYLSPKACAGILRRAAKRGRELPLLLEATLREMALGMDEAQLKVTDIRSTTKARSSCQQVRLPFLS